MCIRDRPHCHHNDVFMDADHVGCHTDTPIQIRFQRVQKIRYHLFICLCCVHRFLGEKYRIMYDFLYHLCRPHFH